MLRSDVIEPDVLIVGAGMAGMSLAVALAELPLSVMVIDRQQPLLQDQWPAGFDPRVSALTLASENILNALGAWPLMQAQRLAPFSGMDVWDADGTGNIQFNAQDSAAEYLGHIVENRVTTAALWQCMAHANNIEFLQTGLQKIMETDDPGSWLVVCEDGTNLRPKLLVGADGGRSRVRDQLGFRCRNWAYGQGAIVTTVTTEEPHNNIARQVFLDSGPLAFLPLRASTRDQQSRISSIVWSVEEAQLNSLMTSPDQEFAEQLAIAFEHRLGRVVEIDRRYSFPLHQNHAVDYAMPGVVLVGDAAHSIHPLAGQGINLGLLDIAVLAEELQRACESGLGVEDFSLLRRYQRRRKPHNLVMMGVMEGFKRLFQSDVPPLRVARNLGMSMLNRHSMIKHQVMTRAMGLEGDLPALAKPQWVADF